MTQEEFNALVQEHGGLAGTNGVGSTTDANGKPIQDPTYEYVFKDGATISLALAKGTNEDATTSGNNTYSVVTPLHRDTSTTPAPKGDTTVSAPASQQFIVTRHPDGTTTNDPNSNYTPPVAPGAAMEATKPVKGTTKVVESNGTIHQEVVVDDKGTWSVDPSVTPVPIAKAANQHTLIHTPSGAWDWDPTTGKASPIQGVPGTQAVRTPAEEAASNASAGDSTARTNLTNLQAQLLATNEPAQRELLQAQIDKAKQDALNASKPSVVGGGTAADRFINTLVSDGNGGWEWHSTPNNNFQPAAPKDIPSSTAPFIMQMVQGADGNWTLQKTPNANAQTVSDSILGMYQQLAPMVKGGQIDLATAKDLLSSAYQAQSLQDTRDNNQANRQQAVATSMADTLTKGSQADDATLMAAAKAGTAPPKGAFSATSTPLGLAFQIMSQGVRDGWLNPNSIPKVPGYNAAPTPQGQDGQAAPNPLSAPAPQAGPAANAPVPVPSAPSAYATPGTQQAPQPQGAPPPDINPQPNDMFNPDGSMK